MSRALALPFESSHSIWTVLVMWHTLSLVGSILTCRFSPHGLDLSTVQVHPQSREVIQCIVGPD